jgi:diguanylate cyclase (GGDEF)-like protein
MPSQYRGEPRLSQFVDVIRGWSTARATATTTLLFLVVLGLEYVTGYAVTVAQLFLAPVALAAVARGMRTAVVAAAITALCGFWVDLHRAPVTIPTSALVWNWTLRGASFAAFALLLVSLCDRIARETSAARIDPLTGASNRIAFREVLDGEVARSGRDGSPLALGYVDLDKFKAVNDGRGHDEGDQVLRAVVAAARTALRQSDSVFRLGGDEFAWLLPGANAAHARTIAERVITTWNQQADARGWPVRLSIGLAILPPGAAGGDILVQGADAAMFAAKRAGGNRVHLVELSSTEQPSQP